MLTSTVRHTVNFVRVRLWYGTGITAVYGFVRVNGCFGRLLSGSYMIFEHLKLDLKHFGPHQFNVNHKDRRQPDETKESPYMEGQRDSESHEALLPTLARSRHRRCQIH